MDSHGAITCRRTSSFAVELVSKPSHVVLVGTALSFEKALSRERQRQGGRVFPMQYCAAVGRVDEKRLERRMIGGMLLRTVVEMSHTLLCGSARLQAVTLRLAGRLTVTKSKTSIGSRILTWEERQAVDRLAIKTNLSPNLLQHYTGP